MIAAERPAETWERKLETRGGASATLLDVNADCPAQSHSPCPCSPYSDSSGGLIQKPTSLTFISVSVLPDGTFGAHGGFGNAWSGIFLIGILLLRQPDTLFDLPQEQTTAVTGDRSGVELRRISRRFWG
jgi:hypothetical protein